MIIASVLKNLLWALRYPSFVSQSNLVGDYHVGAIQTRIPLSDITTATDPNSSLKASSSSVGCQIHYPTSATSSSSSSDPSSTNNLNNNFYPYFRPQAVQGLADYSRQSSSLLDFLSQRSHPCYRNVPPSAIPNKTSQFPIVLFSHGLGGCMEMYTEFCQQLASQGYWVVALEHGEGSGAYAETFDGQTIPYKRPDDTPYSRSKVIDFRRPFLQQRVQEIQSVLDYIFDKNKDYLSSNHDNDNDDDNDDTSTILQQVYKAADTSTRNVHLVGHSFGGATMVLASQEQGATSLSNEYSIQSLGLLDCWAFSLDEATLERGTKVPTLSLISEAWLTNPETKQLQQLLQRSNATGSYYIPNSVHASFSDATHWLPGVVTRRIGLRAPNERKHETIRIAATMCGAHIRSQQLQKTAIIEETISKLIQQEGTLADFGYEASAGANVAVNAASNIS